jgi:hypothetical protein
LDENEAFKLEIELIKNFGRLDKKTGCLRNRSDGGEGPAGSISPFKGIKTGRIPWNKGKTGIYSKETLELISLGTKGRHDSNETKAKKKYNADHQSEEIKSKISASLSGRKRPKEVVEKLVKLKKDIFGLMIIQKIVVLILWSSQYLKNKDLFAGK